MPSTFSYLPPGTPPWPSTPLPKMPYPNEAQGAQPTSTDAASTGKTKRSGPPILAGLVFLVLIPVLFAGVTLGSLYAQGLFPPNSKPLPKVVVPTAQASSNDTTAAPPSTGGQIPNPTSFKTASNVDINLSVQYPSDWVAEAPNKATAFTSMEIHTSSTQGVLIDAVLRHFTDSASTQIPNADAINQDSLSAIESQFSATNVQNIASSSAQQTIGGLKWSQAQATFSVSNGTKIHMTSFAVQRNKSYYNIIFLVPDLAYTEAMQKDLQPMLDSLQFIS